MNGRIVAGSGAAALVAVFLGAGLAGAQLGVVNRQREPEAPAEKTVTEESQKTRITRAVAQPPFSFGDARAFAGPDGLTLTDLVLLPERIVAIADGDDGAVLGSSADGLTWDLAPGGTIGDVDLATTELLAVSSGGQLAVGSTATGAAAPRLAVIGTSGATEGAVFDVAPDPIQGVTDWHMIVDGVHDGPGSHVVFGRMAGQPARAFDPSDPTAVQAVGPGLPFVLGGPNVIGLSPVSIPGLGWLRDAVVTSSGYLAFGADADGYPAVWSSTDGETWASATPGGLDQLDAVLAATARGDDVSLVGVTIEGPMLWRSSDGGASFDTTVLAATPEDLFDVFAEHVVITDSGTLVTATRRAPIVAPAAPTEAQARAESFIETLAWFVTPDGTVGRATGTDLFGADGQVLDVTAESGGLLVRLGGLETERVVFADF